MVLLADWVSALYFTALGGWYLLISVAYYTNQSLPALSSLAVFISMAIYTNQSLPAFSSFTVFLSPLDYASLLHFSDHFLSPSLPLSFCAETDACNLTFHSVQATLPFRNLSAQLLRI